METLAAFDRRFPTEESCRDFLAAQRWQDGVCCPRCNRKEKVYAINSKAYSWRCRNDDCGGRNGYKFSVTTHTIFEDTKIALIVWFRVAYLILVSKKGMSALQVHRVIFGEDSGHDYRTTWYMCQRWRCAMKGDVMPLTGIVEGDETYIGGKAINRHRSAAKKRRGGWDKVAVIGAIARKGMIVAKVIENTDTATLDSFVRQTVSKDAVPHDAMIHISAE